MELSQFTDYSLRALMFAGVESDRLCSVSEIAESYGISRNHLVKVVNRLANLGYLRTVRGRGGGLELARPAEEINVGEVVRQTEPFELVECFGSGESRCGISGCCVLKGVLASAKTAFLKTLDRYTLADLLTPRSEMAAVFRSASKARAIAS